MNTFHMNAIQPVVSKVRKILVTKLSPYLRQAPPPRRKVEIQLEFPWQLKR